MKIKYRIIKKKDCDYFTIHKQTIIKNFWGKEKLSNWGYFDVFNTIEKCEEIINKQIELDKQPDFIVIKEFD